MRTLPPSQEPSPLPIFPIVSLLQFIWVESLLFSSLAAATAAKSHQSCPTLWDPIDSSPPGSHPWDSLGKNTGVGCHFLLQCVKVKSESEIAQSCPTLSDPMDCSLPDSLPIPKRENTYHLIPCCPSTTPPILSSWLQEAVVRNVEVQEKFWTPEGQGRAQSSLCCLKQWLPISGIGIALELELSLSMKQR